MHFGEGGSKLWMIVEKFAEWLGKEGTPSAACRMHMDGCLIDSEKFLGLLL